MGGGGEEVVVALKLKASGEMAKTNKFMMHTDPLRSGEIIKNQNFVRCLASMCSSMW